MARLPVAAALKRNLGCGDAAALFLGAEGVVGGLGAHGREGVAVEERVSGWRRALGEAGEGREEVDRSYVLTGLR